MLRAIRGGTRTSTVRVHAESEVASDSQNDDSGRRFLDRDELEDLAARAEGLGRVLRSAAQRPGVLDPALVDSLIEAARALAWRTRQVTA